MKFVYTVLLISVTSLMGLFGLTACQKPAKDSNTIIVGVISGPEADIMNVAKEVAKKKYDLNVKVVEFSDYSQPNAALNDGSLDANVFQHKMFMESEIKNKGYKLVSIGNTFVYPMAVYSSKIKNITEVPDGGIVAIPNDTSNEARALILLSKAKLITLKPGVDVTATPLDIIDNPKHLQFKELDAAQLPRVLPDVSLSVINTNFAMLAGLYSSKDAVFVEDKTSPYVNLIVTREDNADNPRLKEFVKAYQSPEVLQKANEVFKGQAIAGW